MAGEARFTFAVCKKCGVQSQPLITDPSGSGVADQLDKMGWSIDRRRFMMLATCPECQKR